ncbi:MAG: hypothetical protein MHPSP_004339, partial [Paramarteilia canceri]
IILKGEYKINQLERDKELEAKTKEVLQIICEKTINPQSGQPYPVKVIEKAVDSLNLSLEHKISTKRNALKFIKTLCNSSVIDLCRVKMKFSMKVT